MPPQKGNLKRLLLLYRAIELAHTEVRKELPSKPDALSAINIFFLFILYLLILTTSHSPILLSFF